MAFAPPAPRIVRAGFFESKSLLEVAIYCQEMGLIPMARRCECGAQQSLRERKNGESLQVQWRCSVNGCRKTKSAVDGREFFVWGADNKNRLNLKEVMLLVEYWVWRRSVHDAEVISELSPFYSNFCGCISTWPPAQYTVGSTTFAKFAILRLEIQTCRRWAGLENWFRSTNA